MAYNFEQNLHTLWVYKHTFKTLLILMTFIVNIFLPMWFKFKTELAAICSSHHLHQLYVISRYLSSDLKNVKGSVMWRIGRVWPSFKHHDIENSFRQNSLGELNLRRIIKARVVKWFNAFPILAKNNVRNFNLTDYYNRILAEVWYLLKCTITTLYS